jgi:hypothetical protein
MRNAITKTLAIAAVLGILSGCATTEQIKQIQATADRALEAANNAADRANNAQSTANEALDAARRAQAAADAAQACCNGNSEKINRLIEERARK